MEMRLKYFVSDFLTEGDFNKLRKKYRINPSKNEMRYIYEKYFSHISLNNKIKRFLIKKECRSRSGVLVCTIVLKPSVFSCPKKCSYCPTETDINNNLTQPKSYLSSEPAMIRALKYNFDIKGQINDRINAYINTGNIKDDKSYKLEIIVSGGTWESYPYNYRNEVINDVYCAANTFYDKRDNKSLEEEININETAKFRVIGLTIETRPDYITNMSIKDYRRWGFTRIQLGIQHYNNKILEKINRDCTTEEAIKAIKLLKSCGFKIVCHLMPDLPNSSPELDKWMFDEAINNPDLQFDDVKIYPTAICKSDNPNLIVKSDILEWYEKGLYMPYAEKNLNDLIDVLIYYKTKIQPWIRIQRLVRDIPMQSIEAGYNKISNLRQIILDKMNNENKQCYCIRCMEIGDKEHLLNNIRLSVRKYNASKGIEYFISIECIEEDLKDKIKYYLFLLKSYIYLIFIKKNIYYSNNLNNYKGLIGFCRLRLDKNSGANIITEIKDCALIREVHVYGSSSGIGNNENISTQHKGYGKLLVKTAENIALDNNYNKIAVIAGIGTREYYKNKCGYKLEGTYMIKKLEYSITIFDIIFIIIISIILRYFEKLLNY